MESHELADREGSWTRPAQWTGSSVGSPEPGEEETAGGINVREVSLFTALRSTDTTQITSGVSVEGDKGNQRKGRARRLNQQGGPEGKARGRKKPDKRQVSEQGSAKPVTPRVTGGSNRIQQGNSQRVARGHVVKSVKRGGQGQAQVQDQGALLCWSSTRPDTAM